MEVELNDNSRESINNAVMDENIDFLQTVESAVNDLILYIFDATMDSIDANEFYPAILPNRLFELINNYNIDVMDVLTRSQEGVPPRALLVVVQSYDLTDEQLCRVLRKAEETLQQNNNMAEEEIDVWEAIVNEIERKNLNCQ